MHFSLKKFTDLGCRWNEQPLGEDTFHQLCRRHRITVEEMPLRVGGFYYSLLGGHYIAINSMLPPAEKLFVMFHEFAHFLVHAPDRGETASFHRVGRRTRKELETDAFAACAILPRPVLEKYTTQELIEIEGYAEELVRQRIEIYTKLSI